MHDVGRSWEKGGGEKVSRKSKGKALRVYLYFRCKYHTCFDRVIAFHRPIVFLPSPTPEQGTGHDDLGMMTWEGGDWEGCSASVGGILGELDYGGWEMCGEGVRKFMAKLGESNSTLGRSYRKDTTVFVVEARLGR